MKSLIQRVKQASVTIDGKLYSQINAGILVLLGVEKGDSEEIADKLAEKLERLGIRVEVDSREEKMGYKIREAQLQKTPYMLVVGDNEVGEGKVSVRSRDSKELISMSQDEFISKIREEAKIPSNI